MAVFSFNPEMPEVSLKEISVDRALTSWLRQPSGTMQYKSRRPFRDEGQSLIFRDRP